MSHHLDSPIARQDIASTSRTSTFFAAKQAPCSLSMSATQFSAPFLRPATIRRECTNSKSI